MKTFGQSKPRHLSSRRALDYDGLREKGVHYHPNHLRRMWKQGNFPVPFKPSPRKLAWWEDVIDAWLASKTTGA
jgi:hypothetical protein